MRAIVDLVEDDIISPCAYTHYNHDKKVIVFYGFLSDTKDLKILNNYCEENNFSWSFDDEIFIDYNNHIAYSVLSDVIMIDGELLGRQGFEDEEYDFNSIEDEFINTEKNYKSRCLPHWFSETDLEKNGFEKIEKVFDDNTTSDPLDVIKELQNCRQHIELKVVFKIDYISQFEIGYTAFIK